MHVCVLDAGQHCEALVDVAAVRLFEGMGVVDVEFLVSNGVLKDLGFLEGLGADGADWEAACDDGSSL